jgi:DASH complex subunit DAD3
MASETLDGQAFSASTTSQDEESLTPLEQEVLDEYARLLENLNTVRLSFLLFLSPANSSTSHEMRMSLAPVQDC